MNGTILMQILRKIGTEINEHAYANTHKTEILQPWLGESEKSNKADHKNKKSYILFHFFY